VPTRSTEKMGKGVFTQPGPKVDLHVSQSLWCRLISPPYRFWGIKEMREEAREGNDRRGSTHQSPTESVLNLVEI